MPPGPYRAGGWRGRSAHEADPALGAKPPALGASRTVSAGSAAGPASLPADRAAASARGIAPVIPHKSNEKDQPAVFAKTLDKAFGHSNGPVEPGCWNGEV